MSDERQMLMAFWKETREKAVAVSEQAHVGADVRALIKDLLQICDNLNNLMQHSSAQSADARMFKKKLDQAKAESRELEKGLEAIKKTLFAVVEEVRAVSAEASNILKRYEGVTGSPDAASANLIRISAKKMVEIIVGNNKPKT